jgi:Tol biopolymer transport system component
MTSVDRLEATIAEWLDAESAFHLPDHLGEVVARTAVTRQRPWWSGLERWLPMDLTTRASTLAPPRLGQLILIGLLILALVALAIAAAGAGHRRLPAPYGVAGNGRLVSSADGDIFLLDAVTDSSSPLIAGPTFDFGPVFSRDGTKMSFLRGGPTDCGQPDCGLILAVAEADGSGIRELTPGVPMLDGLDWSPDGTQLAILSAAGDGQGHDLTVVNADGSGMRTLNIARPAHLPSWLPPDGREIVFVGEQLSSDDPPPGIFAVHPDGSGLRQISVRPAVDAQDYGEVNVSPDGTLVGYRGDDGAGGLFQAHVLDLRTGLDRVLPSPAGVGQFGPLFSPDGQSVVYLRGLEGNVVQLVVAPADGSSTGRPIGPQAPLGADGPSINNYAFSPDGKAVVANFDVDKEARLIPIDGSPGSVLIDGELALPAYQRVAP